MTTSRTRNNPPLKRALNLPMMVLYGLGTTVGAGIYALIGELAAVSGYLSPAVFILASVMAALTAFSYAEMASRYPRAAGVALYVKQAFGVEKLSILAGSLVIIAGVVSASALVNGFVGYLNEFVQLDRIVIIPIICITLGLLAAWGIAESVTAAAIVTLVEVGGLLFIVAVSYSGLATLPHRWPELVPAFDLASLGIITSGVFLAFYAFIGFEDMIDVAEEINDVRRTLPLAIMLTLLITTLIYMLVMISAVLSMPLDVLASSEAPLTTLYQSHKGGSAAFITTIGLFAIINGALIQLIMASRVVYGMSSRSQLPAILSRVHPFTRTPLIATALITLLILITALMGRLAMLAELTSVVMLTVFSLVNLALIIVKRRIPSPEGAMVFPTWIPYAGFIVSSSFVIKAITDVLFG